MPRRPSVLVITPWPVAGQIVGPGIRTYQLARALQPHAEVTLAAGESDAPPPSDIEVVTYRHHDPRRLRPLVARADAIVSQPPSATLGAWMRRSGARLIFDLWVPEPLEAMEVHAGEPTLRRRLELMVGLDTLLEALHSGHHFFCAGSRQRDLWLGAMLAERLIGPERYRIDPTFRNTIDTVPLGIPPDPPRATTPGPRQTLDGVGRDDEIVLWNGGIWAWFDAPTAIEAMALLVERRPRAKLVFMGRSSLPAGLKAAEEAERLAAERGLLGGSVIFNDRWVSYEEHPAWILDADCILSTHRDHLESRFAFRTRMLDSLWASLPAVCTRGDELAEEFERRDLGATAPPGDPEGLAAALDGVLERGKASYADAFAREAPSYRWPSVAEPLVRYVTSPDMPPRLGAGSRPRIGLRARSAGYRAVRAALRTARIERM